MSDFDVAICMDHTPLDQVVATLYSRPSLRQTLFAGSQTVQVEGVSLSVAYDVLQPPTVALVAPTAEQWKTAVKGDGTVPQPVENALLVHFPQVKVGKRGSDGTLQETQVSFDAVCTVSLSGTALTIAPLAVMVDLSAASSLDKAIYRYGVIPKVLEQVGTILSGRELPALQFQGVQFGPPLIRIAGGRLTIAGNLAGKEPPASVPEIDCPPSRFVLFLSNEATQQVANAGTRPLVGRSTSTSGSQSFGAGTANYWASVTLTSISASVDPRDSTAVRAGVGFSISANAGVDVAGEITHALSGY